MVTSLGYDPIWFGIIIVMVTEMGVITPPVGINVYVVFGVARNVIGEVPLESIFKGIFPFLLAVVDGVIILIAFLQLILFCPISCTSPERMSARISARVLRLSLRQEPFPALRLH